MDCSRILFPTESRVKQSRNNLQNFIPLRKSKTENSMHLFEFIVVGELKYRFLPASRFFSYKDSTLNSVLFTLKVQLI